MKPRISVPASLARPLAATIAAATWLVPAIAAACPGARGACSSHACSAGTSGLTAVGLGLAIGIGSSALESIFAKRS